MTKWESLWNSFGELMDKLPGAIEEAVGGGVEGATASQVSNGNVILRGHFKSLKINGYTIRVPDHVLRGKK